MYELIVFVFLNGILVPTVYTSSPWTHATCDDKRYSIMSQNDDRVSFKALCFKVSDKEVNGEASTFDTPIRGTTKIPGGVFEEPPK